MKKHLLAYFLFVFFTPTILAQEHNQTPTPQWRPVYHFTPLKNWTNDPNGLIYLNGIYNLYNQQNPYENKINQNNKRQTADVIETNGKIKLEILLDKSSLEVFINDGEKVLTTYVFSDKDADLLSAFSVGGNTLIKNLKIWDLSKVKN